MNRIGIHRIANAITIPIDGEIVACPQRQHMYMNMWHRLSGEFTVRLHGFKMNARDDSAMTFIRRMDVHEGKSRVVPIELVALRGPGNDLAENAPRNGHDALPAIDDLVHAQPATERPASPWDRPESF